MLTAYQLDVLIDPILDLYARYEQTVIEDIARRLAGMSFSSAAWQVQRLNASGLIYKQVLKRLAQLTGQSESTLRAIFKRAGVKTMTFDDSVYAAAGLRPMPMNLSPAMARVLAEGVRKTAGLFNNLTLSTAIAAQEAYFRAADLAYMQVSSGSMSYDQAIKQAIQSVASDGLTTIRYPSGHRDHLDVAIRRTVLTGVGQTALQLQSVRADEMAQDLVQVSAHIGARNKGEGPENHESWQGKIYSRSGNNSRYPNFVEVTGYGTGEGLGGWNCRHSFYPYFEGLSESAYTAEDLKNFAAETVKYNGKEMSVYDATQTQRAIERKIRFWKRQAGALEAGGIGSEAEAAKVKQWQAVMRDFIRQTGLSRQYVRERVLY